MLRLLLTAREGRLSANQPGCPFIAQFPDAPHVAPTSRADAFVCPAVPPGGIPNDKTGNSAGVLYRH
jgi:hypothetical protein